MILENRTSNFREKEVVMKSYSKWILAAVFLAVACQAQTVVLKHTYYTTTFDTTKHIPTVVKWWLTRKMVTCSKKVSRTNKFTPDPQLPKYTNLNKDYAGSGYDRGHNMSAEDNACNMTGMKECFYYSNMCPQTPRLNRGAWKSLETYCRKLTKQNDSLLIWCGSVYTSGNTIGKDKVAVPDYCWKIVYIKKSNETQAYSFKNDTSEAKPISGYEVSVDSVQHLSGLKFIVGR